MSERKKAPRGPMGGGPMGMGGGEKAKNFKKTIGRLLRYMGTHRVSILIVVILSVVGTVFAIVGPKILGRAIDDLAIGATKIQAYNSMRSMTLGDSFADITFSDGRTLKQAEFAAALPDDMRNQSIFELLYADSSGPVTVEQFSRNAMIKVTENPKAQAALQQAFGTLAQQGKLKDGDMAEIQAQQEGSRAEYENMLTRFSPAYKEALMSTDLAGPVPEIDFGGVGSVLLLLVCFYLINTLFNFVQYFIMAGVTQKTVFRLRDEVSQKITRLPMKYFDGNSIGDILSRITNDVDNIANTLQQSVIQIITSVTTIIGIAVMMLTISWKLTLVSVVTVPLSAVVAGIIASKSQKHFKSNQTELGILNGQIEEMYSGKRIVNAYGNEARVKAAFAETNARLYKAGWLSQFMTGIIMPALNFVSNLGFVFVCIVGGILSGRGEITLGAIQSFIQYSKQFSQPIVQTANIANVLQGTAASAERVFEMLDEPEEEPDSTDCTALETVEGNISFTNLKFGYSPDKTLMNNINVDVKSGQTVAIVGPTGAGKTTMVNLLMRFYELDDGAITIDGMNIKNMSRSGLRSMFGMVLQDTWLFAGSIRENIAYGHEGATFEEVVAAADAAYVDHFVRTLPEGYDTELNEEATNVSGGQKQLITIARALLADPEIMILDEATSSVDTRTEVLIQKAMNKLMKGRTSFVIAHRLSTIKNADLILVMKHGDIIEQGTHQSLMEQKGFYCDMYNSQFAGKSIDDMG